MAQELAFQDGAFAAKFLEKALAAAHPDAVYLLHPMATNSAMLGELIDGLRAAGYTLAAL